MQTTIMQWAARFALLLVLGITMMGTALTRVAAQDAAESSSQMLRYDIAEDGTRFVFDDLNLFDDGMPAYGSAFVTQGYIYPEGTLNGSNGVLADGSPEFPDLVLGEWTCYGWMIGEGAHTASGNWVISTQIYAFENGATLITNGFEIADMEVPMMRAITGGTGQYAGARGEQQQILHGFTEQMGVNLSVEFQIADVIGNASASR